MRMNLTNRPLILSFVERFRPAGSQVNPNAFDRAAQLGIDLTLAGHTHGGQVSLAVVRRGLSLASLWTPYVSGWYAKPGGQQLYVNRGIGTTGFPIRIGSPPEITVLELVRGSLE